MHAFWHSNKIIYISYRPGQRGHALHYVLTRSPEVYDHNSSHRPIIYKDTAHGHDRHLYRSDGGLVKCGGLFDNASIDDQQIDLYRRAMESEIDLTALMADANGRYICVATHTCLETGIKLWPNAVFINVSYAHSWIRDLVSKVLLTDIRAVNPSLLDRYIAAATVSGLIVDFDSKHPHEIDLLAMERFQRLPNTQDKKEIIRRSIAPATQIIAEDSKLSDFSINISRLFSKDSFTEEYLRLTRFLGISTMLDPVGQFIAEYLSAQYDRNQASHNLPYTIQNCT